MIKILILLSSKSSGSSAFQYYLVKNYNVNAVEITHHQENETLFWTKTASALSRPQQQMHRSVVPYSTTDGRAGLNRLLVDNLVPYEVIKWDESSCFHAFKGLAVKHSPVFFEKSPHHLFNYSNIDLITKCKEFLSKDVEFHIIGLIRNPLDTIYSAWSRWGYNCKAFEQEWYQSYSNLRQLQETDSDVAVFRYEDIVKDSMSLDLFCEGVGLYKVSKNYAFTNKSLVKWKKSRLFAHQLSSETKALAIHYGYTEEELNNPGKNVLRWRLSELMNIMIYLARKVKKFRVKS